MSLLQSLLTVSFYDRDYYESHYGRLLHDEPYFRIRALYWRKAITSLWHVPEGSALLDYGCGTGQITMAFNNCHYFDISEDSRVLLGNRGKPVYHEPKDIPRSAFDFVLSSHALEHSPRPFDELLDFGRYVKPGGHLLLILPIEKKFLPAMRTDNDNHLFCWTFQTMTNLLLMTGWTPLFQSYIYDSCGLGTLARRVSWESAVHWSWVLGRVKRSFKSMFIVSRRGESQAERSR